MTTYLSPDERPFPIAEKVLRAAVRTLLSERGLVRIAELMNEASSSIELSEYDQWNGGTYHWRWSFDVPLKTFAKLSKQSRDDAVSAIGHCANDCLIQYENDGISVEIAPNLGSLSSAETSRRPPDTEGFSSIDDFLAARELTLEKEKPESGGYAEVYRAKHNILKTSVALKRFSPHPFNADTPHRREKARERILREASILAGIKHPNIVGLRDSSTISGDPILVLDFIEGTTLNESVKKMGYFEEAAALVLFEALLQAVAEVHRQGILHRDISPKNIIVRHNNTPVLIDFGFGFKEEFLSEERLTSFPPGTPGYAAPELASDPLSTSPAIDVYSLGAVAHFMLTGRVPSLVGPSLPANVHLRFREIIAAALSIDPLNRFPSAIEMHAEVMTLVRAPTEADRGSFGQLAALDTGTVRELLGVRDDLDDEFYGAVETRFVGAVSRYRGDQEIGPAGLALLLTGARRAIDNGWNERGASNRCDAKDLVGAFQTLVALLSEDNVAPASVIN